ncbi:hypothetical protein PENSPDRAFT_693256 [Peniophora sp. CONT]|nr:hypothetical protein PENSPDRAFT_693256 [Peniophora sp. CONT]
MIFGLVLRVSILTFVTNETVSPFFKAAVKSYSGHNVATTLAVFLVLVYLPLGAAVVHYWVPGLFLSLWFQLIPSCHYGQGHTAHA